MVFFAFGSIPLLKVFFKTDYPLVVVSSGSMEPTIYKGDILIIKYKDPAEIVAGSHDDRTGDVVLYETNNLWPNPTDQPVVHRVVNAYYDNETNQYMFVTQGDNPVTNTRTDPPGSSLEIPVPEDHLYGVVVGRIPKVGYIKIWMANLPGLSIILIGGLGILLVISIISDIVNPEEKKKQKEAMKAEDLKEISAEINENSNQSSPDPEAEKT